MSNKANPTSIGIFVFTGLVIGVGGILLFSSTKLFTKTAKFVVYFDSSLNGLKEGAPVKYRGVTVGSVSRVMIKFNQATNDSSMPVIFELREDLIRERLSAGTPFGGVIRLDEALRQSLRASLETESILTGVLYVSLDMEPSPPPAVYHQVEPIYQEIPSRPTDIQQLMKNLASMDIGGLAQKINSLLDKVDSSLGTLRVNEITASLTNVLSSVNQLVTAPELTNAIATVKATLDEYRLLGGKINRRVDPLLDQLTNTLAQVDGTLLRSRGGLEHLRELLAPDSPLRQELALALDQLAEASQSVAALAEFLHYNPNALIAGRKAATK